jgi:hypothetical protein
MRNEFELRSWFIAFTRAAAHVAIVGLLLTLFVLHFSRSQKAVVAGNPAQPSVRPTEIEPNPHPR